MSISYGSCSSNGYDVEKNTHVNICIYTYTCKKIPVFKSLFHALKIPKWSSDNATQKLESEQHNPELISGAPEW